MISTCVLWMGHAIFSRTRFILLSIRKGLRPWAHGLGQSPQSWAKGPQSQGHGHEVPAADGPVAHRVALSATQLGIVARLVVPAVAARALGNDVDFPRLADLWFRDVLPAPVPVSVAWQPGPAKITGSAVEEITRAFIAAGLSKIVAWDNLASS